MYSDSMLVLVLSGLGVVSLSALLLTVTLSKRVHRHPVFINFLCTWLAWAAFMTFVETAVLATLAYTDIDTGLKWFASSLEDTLWAWTQVSTLSLVIHLWYTMRAAFHKESERTKEIRTLVLIVSPYLIGLAPLAELFYHSNFILLVMYYIMLALIIITSLWDILLLATFWHHRQILRQVNIRDVMSLAMLVRILVYCLYRLIFTTILLATVLLVYYQGKMSARGPILNFGRFAYVFQSASPLIVFCLLGLQRDVLRVWFPSLTGRFDRPGNAYRTSDTSTDLPDDISMIRQLQLGEPIEDQPIKIEVKTGAINA